MPALWRERGMGTGTPRHLDGRCLVCASRGLPRAKSDPRSYALLTEPRVGGGRTLWAACVCKEYWIAFNYAECFAGMRFVAGKTPPRSLHSVIFTTGLPSHVARHIYDAVRRAHAEAIRDRGWERYFDEAAQKALAGALDGFVFAQLALIPEGPSHGRIHNRRVAEKRKPRQVRRFKRGREACADDSCVPFEKEIQLDGRVYLVGFNLGR